MIHARIEEHVVPHEIVERRTFHVLREAAVPAPVVRHCPAAVRDDEPQRRKVLEQIGGEELHERRRVGVDVVRAGRMEARVARRADVHHGRHVELDHLFVKRIPVPIGQRRSGPMAA